MKVAAIDIGSNSVHLVVSRLYTPGSREVLDREREMLRLGDSTFRDGCVPPRELDRAIDVLKRYRAIAEAHGVNAVLAVATSAIRDARNRDEFLQRAEKEARLAVRIVSGEEEGRLIYAGVRDGLAPTFKRVAVADLGGGSMEIILGDGPKVGFVKSLKLGVLRLAQQFPGRRKKTLEALERHVRGELAPAAKEIRKWAPDATLGTSGTIMALAGLLGVRQDGRPIRLADLDELSKQLLEASPEEIRERYDVDKDRADTIGPGSLVIRVLMEESGLEEIHPCERALREGVVADYASRNAESLGPHDEEISDPRRRSVYFLARRLGALDPHSRQTARLALKLFDTLSPVHGLEPGDRELLEYAALLHDAGYWIGADKHHKHAYYLITEGPLENFSRDEVRIIALAARYHRGRPPRKRHLAWSRLPRKDRRRVAGLAALLRIADGLDRGHAGLVKDLACAIDGDAVTIRLASDGDPHLELYAAERRGDLFRDEFRRALAFEVGRRGSP
jgi:exopolyphosphatase/guanosine-5'-triphosphate,3'-diphosphate pyrophosphatase